MWILATTFLLCRIILPYTIYSLDTGSLIIKWRQQKVKQKHIDSLCLSLTEVPKFSCESNKNRSENLAPIQTNIKLIKNQNQWDNLMGTFTGKRSLKWDQSGLIMFDLYFQGVPLIEWKLSFSPNTGLKMTN